MFASLKMLVLVAEMFLGSIYKRCHYGVTIQHDDYVSICNGVVLLKACVTLLLLLVKPMMEKNASHVLGQRIITARQLHADVE